MVKRKRNNFWKPVEVNLSDDTSDLICFEELVDYQTVRGKSTHDDDNDSDYDADQKHRVKKQKKDFGHGLRVDDEEIEITDDDQPRQKKEKKNKKKKGTKKVVEVIFQKPDQEITKLQSNVPVDMSAWAEFGLAEPIERALALKKFTSPTEIQRLSLPKAITEGKDILGAAETGSGKTLAFAIPIMNAILEAQSSNQSIDFLWALILTPTRELAIQVRNHIRDVCSSTDIKVQEVVGGLSVEKQNRKLSEKPQIVVGTPGRIWELIRLGNEHLSQITKLKYFVIDEADRMFEKGHFVELDNILEKMNLAQNKGRRQVFVFSATLTLIHAPPSYVYNKKKGKKKGPLKPTSDQKLTSFIKSLGLKNPAIIDVTKKNILNPSISESLVQCTLEEKDYYLYYILKVHSGKKMVFCNSVNCVKRLHRLLNILQLNAKILFADMDQKQRLKNLESFEKHPNGLLVTTDVAARGLDIASIDYIIHYQVPKTAEIYVHRSGRSVRGVSAVGNSILLCGPGEDHSYNRIMKTLSKETKLDAYQLSAPEVFANAKRVVNVSRKIEYIEMKMRNLQSNANSIEKWAKEMDIVLDEDEIPEKLNDGARKSCQSELKKLRAELNQLLTRPVIPLTESLRYPRFEVVQAFLQKRITNKNK